MTLDSARTVSAPVIEARSPVDARYQRYALVLLMITYAFNMLDRQIVTILAEPMKADLHLHDWQLGAITGLAFAIFYTVLGIPMARLADRADRAYIIAGSLAVWSAFTVLCGLTRTFPELLLARLGVGVGEAGGTPPAHSLITEYTPKAKRASALAFYSLGIPLGSLIGMAMGGLIADSLGWRAAFLIAGAPGLVLAVVVALTLKEPRRALKGLAARAPAAPLGEALRELRSKPAFWFISFAAGFAAFAYYGQAAFYGSLFMRTHAVELAAMAKPFGLGPGGFLGLSLGLIIGSCAGLGTFVGGRLADRAARKGIEGYPRMNMLTLAIAAPLFAGVALAGQAILAMAFLAPAIFMHSLSYGSTFASIQSLVQPRNRAMAAAVCIFLTNLIGLGFGPLAIGALSDVLAPGLGAIMGLRVAMAMAAIFILVSAGCFVMAARTIRRDEHIEA